MEAYPLQWPIGWERGSSSIPSRFGRGNKKPTIAQATEKLLYNLKKFTGKGEIIITSNLKLRQDGLPYSNQPEPIDKGVAIYFYMTDNSAWGEDNVPMVIASDTFNKIGCNIYACALTIEAMRGIERWGASQLLNRAFIGFKAITAPQQRQWWEILEVKESASDIEINEAYRKLSRKYHPDVPGGSHEKMTELNNARQRSLKK